MSFSSDALPPQLGRGIDDDKILNEKLSEPQKIELGKQLEKNGMRIVPKSLPEFIFGLIRGKNEYYTALADRYIKFNKLIHENDITILIFAKIVQEDVRVDDSDFYLMQDILGLKFASSDHKINKHKLLFLSEHAQFGKAQQIHAQYDHIPVVQSLVHEMTKLYEEWGPETSPGRLQEIKQHLEALHYNLIAVSDLLQNIIKSPKGMEALHSFSIHMDPASLKTVRDKGQESTYKMEEQVMLTLAPGFRGDKQFSSEDLAFLKAKVDAYIRAFVQPFPRMSSFQSKGLQR